MAEGDHKHPIALAALGQPGATALLDPSLCTAASLNPATSSLPMEFWVWQYKVHMCPLSEPHQWDSCAYAHPGEKARRRHPSKYYAVHCPYSKLKKPCPAGEECPCTHSLFEFWLHPTRFRTSICSRGTKCNRQTCFFAHSEADLRIATTPAPDPLLAESVLNSLATPIPGSDEMELPQLDGATLRHLIEICMQNQPQQPPQQLAPGALSNPDYGNSSSKNLGSAQIVPDLGQHRAYQQQQFQQQHMPSAGIPGLLRLLPDNDMDSGTLNFSSAGSAFSQQETDMSICPSWESDRLPVPPGSIQQQMQLMRQRQQPQPMQRLAPATVIGPGAGVVSSSAGASACSSPGSRPMGLWGDEVKILPWDGQHRGQQQMGRSQQQQFQSGSLSGSSMMLSAPNSGMLSTCSTTSTNSHVLQLVSNSSLPIISAGPSGPCYGSSPMILLPQEPVDDAQVFHDFIMQPVSGGGFSAAMSTSGGLGSDHGGSLGAGRQMLGMQSPVQQQHMRQHQPQPQQQPQRPPALNQLMGNVQVLTKATGTGHLPDGGIGAIGEDLTKLLSPADQKALVVYMLSQLNRH